MAEVTSTIQLSTFSVIKSVLRTNSTINTKFTTNDYYEFEPNTKAVSFNGYPYFLIRVPTTDTNLLVLNNSTTIKDFSVQILMRMDYEARANFTKYAGAVISTIESSSAASTFEANGYYNTKIELLSVSDKTIIDEKQIVEADFLLTFHGNVNR